MSRVAKHIVLKNVHWCMLRAAYILSASVPFLKVATSFGLLLDHLQSAELVGGLEDFSFFHILGIIIPNNCHIFQRGRVLPPSRYIEYP